MSETFITGHPLDECWCGDYRRYHSGGTGPCSLCDNVNLPEYPKCKQFRLRVPATQADVERFRQLGIEYPEVKS